VFLSHHQSVVDDGTVEGIVKLADGKQLDDALATFPAAGRDDAAQNCKVVARSMVLKRFFISFLRGSRR